MSAGSRYAERGDVLSWGRVVRRPQRVARPHFADELPALLAEAKTTSALAIGLRRSYGDTCLNSEGAVIDMTGLDHFIAFDAETGLLRAEAGVSLSDVLKLVVPKGWFLPTTPGTRFVTLGGAVANDVHGKNHHRAGSMGCHVTRLGLLRGDGERLTLGPDENTGLFAATIGGLGLTGLIEWVELRLPKIGSSFLDVEIIPYGSLEEFWTLAEESSERFEHTVAWADCMPSGGGRGVFSRANWTGEGDYKAHGDRTLKSIPVDFPGFALNKLSVSAFNELYFRAHRWKAGRTRQHYSGFFYPLDAIHNWNRLYGKRGMLQFQCVVPWASARPAMDELMAAIAQSGQASFLTVLKTFGDIASPGLMSFPRPGATLALDFPNRGEETLALMGRLDAITREAGGALYPAKDGRMSAAMFRLSFPRWEEFAQATDTHFSSDFWRRMTA